MNFETALGQKYAILGQQADAATSQAQAGALDARSRAGLSAAQAAAIPANVDITRQQVNQMGQEVGAKVGLMGAQTDLENTQNQLTPGHMMAQNALADAQAGHMGMLTQRSGTGASDNLADAAWRRTLHPGTTGFYSNGTAEIQGQGSPAVDSVPAMLAPKEAVLNAGAAEHLGRDVIQALNAIGAHNMGMIPGKGSPQPTEDDRAKAAAKPAKAAYAKGTAKVAKGKAPAPAAKGAPSDTPSINQIDPAVLMKALAMGQGGGMPGPQGAMGQMPQQMMPPGGGVM